GDDGDSGDGDGRPQTHHQCRCDSCQQQTLRDGEYQDDQRTGTGSKRRGPDDRPRLAPIERALRHRGIGHMDLTATTSIMVMMIVAMIMSMVVRSVGLGGSV